ncbi:MAG: DUF4278 domain-containing protein [Gloeomargaritaceae cyanobacterium C42_A2020_066]|nr:DUF4278 domain-containing protein [Gloeomargaritaceae cyanobacterium C42_A2020_066]
MKLLFLGETYDHEAPAVDVKEGEVGGKYRGVWWRVHRTSVNLGSHQVSDLKYRGVTYRH